MLRLSLTIYPTWERRDLKGIELNSKTYLPRLTTVGSNSSDAGTIVPSGLQLGVGTRVASTYRIGEQSTVINRQIFRSSHQWSRFFQIQLPDGDTGYTRDGSFQLNADGQLVNADGFPLVQNITIDQAAVGITINQNGQVLLKFDGQQAETIAGTVQLATFQNKAGLEHIGRNLQKQQEARQQQQPIQGQLALAR